MTQEEKATRYDGAIEKAKKELNTCGSQDCDAARQIFRLFPELKDEDERIRENIIATIHLYYGEPLEDEAKDMIAWLEKQGEQKPAKNSGKKSEDVIEEKDMTEYKKGFECGKQRVLKYPEDFNLCKKPAWSEEDEDTLNTIINHFKVDIECTDEDDIIRWLKSLKERVLPQPKQEWSEEDEKNFKKAIKVLKVTNFHHTADMLQEMKYKLISSEKTNWKPSDEQIEALESATENCAYSEYQDCLHELIMQLKKLREE